MAKLSKKVAASREGIDRNAVYPIAEAVKLIKGKASARFDESVEIALNLNVDPRHADQMVRGVVNLPGGTGKTVRVAVFAKGDKAEARSEERRLGKECVSPRRSRCGPNHKKKNT